MKSPRIQFSLRTLMVGVLIYGTLWLLTATLGANRLLRAEARAYESGECKFRQGNKDGSATVSFPNSTPRRRGSAWALAPFVLISHWDIARETQPDDWIDFRDSRIWVLGCNFTIRKGREPSFIPEFDEENIGFVLTVTSTLTPGLKRGIGRMRE